jgi:outer membrane lipoprotein-sorting protein
MSALCNRRSHVRVLAVGWLGLVVLGSLVATADAQTIDEIVALHAAARGSAEQWRAVRTLRMTGRALAGPGREALVTREIKRPDRIRTEFTFQGITGVFAFDGKRGWQVSPLTGVLDPQLMEPGDTMVAMQQIDVDGALVSARKQGAKLVLIGHETVAGRDALRIRVTPKTGPEQEQFLDAGTFLILRSDSTRQVGGRAVVVETTFGDYRSVGGLTLPHAIEMGARDRPQRVRIIVENIEVNPPIDDTRFKMPPGAKR